MSPSPDEKLRVAYLSGSGHTGTTLTALLMDCHPQIASIGEAHPTRQKQAYMNARIPCSCGVPYGECPFWREVFAEVGRRGLDLGPGNWSTDHRYRSDLLHKVFTRYSRFPLWRAFQEAAARRLPFHAARMRRIDRVNVAVVEAVLAITGRQVFFDTSKYSSRLYHLLQLPQLDVKVVKIVRDVRGMASSAKRRGHDVRWAATTWLHHQRVIDHVTRSLGPDRLLQVRYEDLYSEPRTSFQSLYRFLGVDVVEPPTSVDPHDHHVMGNPLRRRGVATIRPPERWQDHLAAQEVVAIMRIAGSRNRELGYAS